MRRPFRLVPASLPARLAAFVLAALVLAAGPALALSDQDRDDLARVSAYLNGISSLTGEFAQFAPDGTLDQGRFWLRKPGRMRFEYQAPNPNLIVSDGYTVAVINAELKTQDRYPLVDTPLSVLLKDNIDLARDVTIKSVERQDGSLRVTAVETDGPAKGEISLLFADPGLQLRQWTIVDAQGLETTVSVRALRQDVEVDPKLFFIEDADRFTRSD